MNSILAVACTAMTHGSPKDPIDTAQEYTIRWHHAFREKRRLHIPWKCELHQLQTWSCQTNLENIPCREYSGCVVYNHEKWDPMNYNLYNTKSINGLPTPSFSSKMELPYFCTKIRSSFFPKRDEVVRSRKIVFHMYGSTALLSTYIKLPDFCTDMDHWSVHDFLYEARRKFRKCMIPYI